MFVEKPLAGTAREALDLSRLAEQQRRVLMVDHLLLFHPAVQELEAVVRSGELGQVHYIFSRRTNLGVLRTEENALWSLGPHDIAVMLSLMGKMPTHVTAQGGAYVQRQAGIHDVVFVVLRFPHGNIGHLHLSWLDPQKVRQITVVGDRKMAVFDDAISEGKLRLYDIEMEPGSPFGVPVLHQRGVETREISPDEPLALACQQFLKDIEHGVASINDGRAGTEVVKVLEAAQSSLDSGGMPVKLEGDTYL